MKTLSEIRTFSKLYFIELPFDLWGRYLEALNSDADHFIKMNEHLKGEFPRCHFELDIFDDSAHAHLRVYSDYCGFGVLDTLYMEILYFLNGCDNLSHRLVSKARAEIVSTQYIAKLSEREWLHANISSESDVEHLYKPSFIDIIKRKKRPIQKKEYKCNLKNLLLEAFDGDVYDAILTSRKYDDLNNCFTKCRILDFSIIKNTRIGGDERIIHDMRKLILEHGNNIPARKSGSDEIHFSTLEYLPITESNLSYADFIKNLSITYCKKHNITDYLVNGERILSEAGPSLSEDNSPTMMITSAITSKYMICVFFHDKSKLVITEDGFF
jgi:hypothetical protein